MLDLYSLESTSVVPRPSKLDSSDRKASSTSSSYPGD
jgi:hypothetical protein